MPDPHLAKLLNFPPRRILKRRHLRLRISLRSEFGAASGSVRRAADQLRQLLHL